ncbi:DUF2231 domain-containing protein [Actinacidiphila glaucinigra]|uniref:DUF2231 domain-containing protein n=1 Tax=Actinacidiphila glaucinigra TaxID=235986 RepID=UPI002E31F16D|nr:DUF2231 domain-containing protein [Actinacidiphila glaucinigra]
MSVGSFNDLPSHPLFVHGVVVLIPLTALALVACTLWPAVARRFGWLLPVLGLVSLALVVLTAESGEWLEERVKETALVERHAEMGEGLTPWAIALFVLTTAVWWLGHVTAPRDPAAGEAVPRATSHRASSTVGLASSVPVRVAAVVIVLAVTVGAVIEVYRIGDSGAKAVWQGEFSTGEPGAE